MKCIDLFSGCGGMSLGFTQAGIDILLAIDNWDLAVQTYSNNFQHPILNKNLADTPSIVSLLRPYAPDIIIGGPPCQDFSSAGKRDVTLGRADLSRSYANIINQLNPEWFVMENVPQIKKTLIFDEIIESFKENGYGLTVVILNAAYCGVPQARNRLFVIGKKNANHNFLASGINSHVQKAPMTMRDYFGDTLGLEHYYRHPRNYNRRGIFSLDEPCPTIRGVNRPLPSGYKLNKCDPIGVDLEKIRSLTPTERAMVQTFPPGFMFSGSKTNIEQMIGNAVPVKMAELIAKSIIEFRSSDLIQSNLFGSPEIFKIPNSLLVKDGKD